MATYIGEYGNFYTPDSALPSGAIIMWSGTIATIPAGFHLCDGTHGTPDLRNRFIVCATADAAGVATSTITGPAAQSGGTTDLGVVPNIPGNGTFGGNDGAFVDIDSPVTYTSPYAPPFFALAYIQKM